MTDTLKTLGQSNPAAGVLTTLYTVPSATSTTVSTITVCNQSSSAQTFRISVAVAAAADTPAQYLYYNTPIGSNDTFTATIGMTLAATDLIRVYSSIGSVSFNAFGVEIT